MPDLWNAQDSSQYNLAGAPAAYQQPSAQASGGDPVNTSTGAPGQFQHQIYHPANQDDYDKIPPGAIFIDPQDGKMYQKTAVQKGMET